MAAPRPAGNVFRFRDARAVPDPVIEPVLDGPAVLVLDNGSFQLRAGWAGVGPQMQFRSVVARSRGGPRSLSRVGNDIPSLEPLRWLLRTPFDRNLPVNLELQELLCDHVFQRLGVASEGCVDHPIMFTEAPCTPLHVRQMVSELLFECYHVPRVSFGIDGLYSFYHNKKEPYPTSGLIVSSGYYCTHILPLLNGRLDGKNCKRINVGGSHAVNYLHRLMQLKYPGHLSAITLSRMEEILHEHCYIPDDYIEELKKWRCPDYYEQNVHKMQLPFSSKLMGSAVPSEEKQERRQQQLKRLQELNARRREEKLQQDQERLERLLYVQELLEDGQVDQFHKALVELNMDSAEELQSYIHKLSAAVDQGRQRFLGETMDSKPQTPEPLGGEQEDMEGILESMFNVAEYHQMYLGTERIRVPEVLFQPSLIGEDQAGLAETMQYILDQYPQEVQQQLVQNVFLTGGNVMYPGMQTRMEKELLMMRPFGSTFHVSMAANPVLDAWHGASDWALQNLEVDEGWISRKEYEEMGGEYLKEHVASNSHTAIHLPKPPPPRTAAAPNSQEMESALQTSSGTVPP
ncbi:PREDICTED: LOW QUALITY PROTEIN: actin-related protein 5 [Nanorana parkeri]|uniref:LOW QUALITY PROTEIN: actin-related protein 5 n=1 Tax=Nanorana parkeri TaxID=125878 RepID=UPI000854303F|nr:PREDICTED: LOW QUALITY PROTEIN: actin-related protein 5 [Nanorana parkeri]